MAGNVLVVLASIVNILFYGTMVVVTTVGRRPEDRSGKIFFMASGVFALFVNLVLAVQYVSS